MTLAVKKLTKSQAKSFNENSDLRKLPFPRDLFRAMGDLCCNLFLGPLFLHNLPHHISLERSLFTIFLTYPLPLPPHTFL